MGRKAKGQKIKRFIEEFDLVLERKRAKDEVLAKEAAVDKEMAEGVEATIGADGIPVISTGENAFEIFANKAYKYGYVNMEWPDIHGVLVSRRTRKDIPYHLRYRPFWDIVEENMRGLPISCASLDDLVFIHTRAEHLHGNCKFGVFRENPVVHKWPEHVYGRKTSKCLFNNLLMAKPLDDTRKGEVIAALGILLSKGFSQTELSEDKRILLKRVHTSISSGLFNKKTRDSTGYSLTNINNILRHLFSRAIGGESQDSYVRWLLNYLCHQPAESFLPKGHRTFQVYISKKAKGGIITKVDVPTMLTELRMLTTDARAEEMLCDGAVRNAIESCYICMMRLAGAAESVVDHIIAKSEGFLQVDLQ